jgi:hypothetical protein
MSKYLNPACRAQAELQDGKKMRCDIGNQISFGRAGRIEGDVDKLYQS